MFWVFLIGKIPFIQTEQKQSDSIPCCFQLFALHNLVSENIVSVFSSHDETFSLAVLAKYWYIFLKHL